MAVGPDGHNAFRLYWQAEKLPFVGLADNLHEVADRYKQEVNLFKLGRMPALVVLDKRGLIRYQHYAASMADIPENRLVLDELDKINR